MRKVIALLMIIALSCAVQASDWPKWRGPHNTGVSHETAWNPNALSGMPDILWKAEIGKGHAGIVIADGKVFSMGSKLRVRGTDSTWVDEVVCLDRKTGKKHWSYTYPSDNRTWPGPRATPTVNNGTLYTLGWEGQFYAFDTEDGRVKWMHHLVDEGISARPDWGFCASPVVVDELVILAAGQSGVAFNRTTGAVVWHNGEGTPTLPTPLAFEADGKTVVGMAVGQNFVILDAKTGAEQTQYPFYNTDIDPILIDGHLFMASGGGSRTLKLTGLQHEEIMTSRQARFMAWQNFVIVNGHAYGFYRQGRRAGLQCIDIFTGETKWREAMGEWGSTMAAGDKLIILTGHGHIRIADASPEGFKLHSEASVMKMASNTGVQNEYQCHCWTQPVLLDGQIFARNNWGELVCVNMK